MRLLDNMGIRINMAQLKSWPQYAAVRRSLNGRGFLGRFWAQRVRPRIFPDDQAAIEWAYREIRGIHQREFISSILDQGQTQIEKHLQESDDASPPV